MLVSNVRGLVAADLGVWVIEAGEAVVKYVTDALRSKRGKGRISGLRSDHNSLFA